MSLTQGFINENFYLCNVHLKKLFTMAKRKKTQILDRLAKLTSDNGELLCRINKLISNTKEPAELAATKQ